VSQRADQLFAIVGSPRDDRQPLYLSCTADTENEGHRFGESFREDKALSPPDTVSPTITVFVALAALALAACQGKPEIPLAPYAADYRTKPDFAWIEHQFPLTRADLVRLTPQNVAALDQEAIDQVYARLTAGPIPDGAYEGTFFLAEGGGLGRLREVLAVSRRRPAQAGTSQCCRHAWREGFSRQARLQ
jgi:hypothetical protein